MSSSDAPVRPAGTRVRSGNAMLRTRAALLEAAAGCLQERGVRRTTMGDVAQAAGVAKATLYNHFRTKDDVLRALVDSRVEGLGAAACVDAAETGLPSALERAAAGIAADGALRTVATGEPALLLALLAPGESRGWAQARTAVVSVLSAAGAPTGPQAVDAVLRWLVGLLLWPATSDQARLGAALLAGLGDAPAAQTVATAPVGAVEGASGVGWPG